MALVALTDEQKNQLSTTGRFQTITEYSILNKARYWSQLDGNSVPGNDRIKWAKNRTYSANILRNVIQAGSSEYPKLALTFLTQPVWENTVPFNADTVITYMITNSIFETLADYIFELKVKEIQF